MENQICFCFSAASPFFTYEKVANVYIIYGLDNCQLIQVITLQKKVICLVL